MLLCGIHDGHNSAAAIVKDGVLVGALQEERVSRVKNWHGFPEQAIETLLKSVGAGWGDVDRYLFNGNEYYLPPGGRPGDREAQCRIYKNNATMMGSIRQQLRKTPLRNVVQSQRQEQRLAGLLGRGVKRERIVPMDHHGCHAAAAYYGRGADPESLVITLDGAGDGVCATVSVPKNGKLERLHAIDEEHSIGILWNIITAIMGMVPNEHEYKMMGMAPYAGGKRAKSVEDIFARAYRTVEGGWERTGGLPEANYAYLYWREALEMARFDYIFAGLQSFTEDLIAPWVQHWLRKTGRRRLCLSGGVFMNVKLNKILCELPEVDDVYVFPSCGDETNTMGACWQFLEQQGKADTIKPMGPFYLGLEPTREQYDKAAADAKARGFIVEQPGDVEDAVATLLASGEVVARCNGREEFGARALGNRSIMADPSRREVVRVINKAIKSRDFWMPFACSMLDEAAHEYLKNPKGIKAPYMILTFDSLNTEKIIAGCHPEDGTVRPQIVTPDWNPTYHRTLKLFREKTGRGAILNTSLNLHGEPMVSTPADSIDVMARSGLNNLCMGPYVIRKPGSMRQ
ncbi:MAG: carbamoyltransferase C-terminal domain-containing protein [Phycisphaerales bacterium]